MSSKNISLRFGSTSTSGQYRYCKSGVISSSNIVPYLKTNFRISTSNVVTAGTYYVGLSSSSTYGGTNPESFLNYGYISVSETANSAISVYFGIKYPSSYTNLYFYVIKSGTSGTIFNSGTGTLTQYWGNSFSFNIYKPTPAKSISYNWNGGTEYSSTSTYATVTKNDIKYTDTLYVKVNYDSSKNPDHTACVISNGSVYKGQISTSESSGGTTQILTISASDIGFYYMQSNGSVTQGKSGTRLDLYSIIKNPCTIISGLVYNGSEQKGITGRSNYVTGSGSTTGTAAGTYTFKVTAKDGYYFDVSGNSSSKKTSITMTWTIAKKTWNLQDHCTIYNRTYNGSNQTIFTYKGAETLPSDSSCGSTILVGVNNTNLTPGENLEIYNSGSISRTNAGTYNMWGKAVSLVNPNYEIGSYGLINLGTSTISKASSTMTFSVGAKSVFCTSSATTASSTDADKTVTIESAANPIGSVTYKLTQAVSTENGSNVNWSLSGTTLTIPRGTAAGNYTVVVTATDAGNSNYSGKTVAAPFTVTVKEVTLSDSDYNSSNSDWYAKISIGSGITAAGGSATITASAGHTHYYYEHYSNGANSSQKSKAVNDGGTLSIDSQYIATSSNASSGTAIDRFSISGKTLNHKNMDKSTGWDTVNVKVTNDANKSVINTARTYVQNSVGAYYNTSSIYSYGTPSLTLTNNLTAAGGSVTVTCSVTDTYYRRRDYDSGSYDLDTNHTKAGTACWRITSNGNRRFGYSGSAHTHGSTSYYSSSKVTHSSMSTNATTDTVGITAYNHNDTTKTSGEKTASVTNKNLGSNRVSEHDTTGSTSRTHYGYQIINFASVGDISAAGGSSYGQGTGQSRTRTESGTYPRYAYATTYTAYNDGDNNAHGSVTYSDGSVTWSGSYSDWTSWGGNTTVKGNTISASSLGTTVKSRTYIGTSSVTWNGVSASADIYQAANSKDSSSTAFNGRTQNCYQPYTDYRIINFASVGDIPAGGGTSYGQGTGQSRTCYTGSTYTKYDYYYLYTAYHDGDTSAKTHHYTSTKSGWTDGATPGCDSWGNVETVTGSTVTVSSLGTTVKAVTKVGTSSVTWHSKTASADISQAENKLESISIVLGSSAVSKPGGDSTGHPSSAHYDLAYGSSTSPTVTATYTSGSTANVTSSSTITSSDTTVATVS